MSPLEMKTTLNQYGEMVVSWLKNWIANCRLCVFPKLTEAMEHSLLAGGKRIRPALFLAWADTGVEVCCENLLPFAAAIEMIHTYSLIHDDLPPMDNADLRRGKPSCHKQFGEATAMLAGDALLTDAFYVATKCKAKPDNLLMAIRQLALAAGSSGMVDGQMLDLVSVTHGKLSLNELRLLQEKKTGAMFAASCKCGAILCDAGQKLINKAHNYGMHLGAAFQIIDDVMDVTGTSESMGKPNGLDAANDRFTWTGLLGVEGSINQAKNEASLALREVEDVPEPAASFLRALVDYVLLRKS